MQAHVAHIDPSCTPFDFSNAEAVEWPLKIPDFMKIIRVVI
jgi:hypothetical protein